MYTVHALIPSFWSGQVSVRFWISRMILHYWLPVNDLILLLQYLGWLVGIFIQLWFLFLLLYFIFNTLFQPEFCSLTHLIRLDLSKNQLQELPSDFGRLVNLQHLDLYNNKLISLPVTFAQLKVRCLLRQPKGKNGFVSSCFSLSLYLYCKISFPLHFEYLKTCKLAEDENCTSSYPPGSNN